MKEQSFLRYFAGGLLTFLKERPDLVDELDLPYSASNLIKYLEWIGIKKEEIVCDTQHPYVARMALRNMVERAAPIFGSFNKGRKFGRRPIAKLMRGLNVESK